MQNLTDYFRGRVADGNPDARGQTLREVLEKIKANPDAIRQFLSALFRALGQADPHGSEREEVRRRADADFNVGRGDGTLLGRYWEFIRADLWDARASWDLSGAGVARKTLEEFHPRTQWPSVASALQGATRFLQGERALLTLAGPPGTGKTHLLLGIARRLADMKQMFLFRREDQLLGDLKAVVAGGGRLEHRLSDYLECRWLLIDDLGVASETPWSREIMDRIIDHRWAQGLPLAVATNAKSGDLPARLADRLADVEAGIVVQIDAPSYRRNPE